MRLSTALILAFAVAALGYLGVKWRHSAGAPEAGREAAVAGVNAAEIYNYHCADCHGEAGSAHGNAPDLRTFAGTEEEFRDTVFAGFYPMPEYEGVLSPDEVEALWVYLSAMPDPAA